MMTAARPYTSWPVPMVAEKLRCSWHTTQPARATRALVRTKPRIFTLPRSLARVVTRSALSPTARSSRPDLVLKYRSSTSFTTRISTRDTTSFRSMSVSFPSRAMVDGAVKMVSVPRSTVRLEPLAMYRLMENRAVMVMMPASRLRIFSRTWMTPVNRPARAPAAREIGSVSQAFTPRVSKIAVTAAPRGKVPSTPRSGKSRME